MSNSFMRSLDFINTSGCKKDRNSIFTKGEKEVLTFNLYNVNEEEIKTGRIIFPFYEVSGRGEGRNIGMFVTVVGGAKVAV